MMLGFSEFFPIEDWSLTPKEVIPTGNTVTYHIIVNLLYLVASIVI